MLAVCPRKTSRPDEQMPCRDVLKSVVESLVLLNPADALFAAGRTPADLIAFT